MKMGERIPGPIKLQYWQACMLVLYLLFRFYLGGASTWFSGAGGKTCAARHILVDNNEQAMKIKSQLEKKPDTFAKLAAEHSKCPSGKNGGKLGSFPPGRMVPAFDKVCFDPAVSVGEIVGPVKTQFGYHLLVIDSREGVDSESKKND